MTPQPTILAMVRYCNRIKNEAKRRYACDYAQFLIHGITRPDDPRDLSYMAAQAVRMNLADIIEGRQ